MSIEMITSKRAADSGGFVCETLIRDRKPLNDGICSNRMSHDASGRNRRIFY